MGEAETTALEEAAGEKLGVQSWDRPAIFRDTAEAATQNRLPYWMVLVLSGAIATLGLAINSSAVVIGAMLVAPLLAPVVGLALALAVGDGRLAVQTGAVVIASTTAVVLTSALLTVLLPFQSITLEISARTRPTTLDLAIAVFSGLVAVVVTLGRGSRLSAAIPGVAISVALIPPLAVAGFGIGVGWNFDLIYGSLLLYGANLAGIVLSGMTVFMLVGMHRADVMDAARLWHDHEAAHGISAWAGRAPWIRSLGVFRSPWSRVALVAGFAVALGLPLSESLSQISREARVERAVGEAAGALFDLRERSSILSRQVVYGSEDTEVYLRVATTEWFDADVQEEFERRASAGAGEPVRLSLEQLPARGEDLEQLASLLQRGEPRSAASAPPPANLPDLLASTRLRLRRVEGTLVAPEGVELVGAELVVADAGTAVLRLAYAAPEPLQSQAAEMLRRQLALAPDLRGVEVRLDHLSTTPVPLTGTPADSAVIGRVAEGLSRYALRAELLYAQGMDPEEVEAARGRLLEAGVPAEHLRVRAGGATGLQLRLTPRRRGGGDTTAADDR